MPAELRVRRAGGHQVEDLETPTQPCEYQLVAMASFVKVCQLRIEAVHLAEKALAAGECPFGIYTYLRQADASPFVCMPELPEQAHIASAAAGQLARNR